jgi:integrase
MLDYTLRGAGKYGGHPQRLAPLRRYLIAAITTLARPDAILDMSVDPDRAQWLRDDRLFALNPAGRIQTKKYRPVVPVGDLLGEWLEATTDRFVCFEHEREDNDGKPYIEQVGVNSIRSGWDSMRLHLKLPARWGPKLLRHSMATLLRNRRVDPWELKGQMGHKIPGSTEIYATYDPDYLGTVQAGIADIVSDLSKPAGAALHPKRTQRSTNVVDLEQKRRA